MLEDEDYQSSDVNYLCLEPAVQKFFGQIQERRSEALSEDSVPVPQVTPSLSKSSVPV